MKLSLNWIKDFVDIPADFDLKKLAYDLTMRTVEVEDMVYIPDSFKNIIVGKIVEILPHPNADMLRICRTDIGGGEIKEIVCGGSNLAEGMKVAVSAPGAIVRWHGEGEPVEIKVSKLRGVESFGMICAASEIGLGDLFRTEGEREILDLSAFPGEPGTCVANALGLDDYVLEIDNKSMTNRPDLWGHYGIAREIAAIYDLPLKKIEPFAGMDGNGFVIDVQDTERCPRYMGMQIENLSVKPAPFEMQSRLWRVGQRPINALVDITNYVMMATGQPTHAFDADHIKGHIVVRRAGEGEHLDLLNGKKLELTSDDLVIADTESPVGLAGVMGGSKDSILPETHRVILEVANFDGKGIRRTALRYENRTEAATRYEKAIDPERCDITMALAVQLFKEIYPELSVSGFCDVYPNHLVPTEIDVSLDWLTRRLGERIPNEVMEKKLSEMGFTVTFDGDNMHVVSPTWRSTGDISIKDDIMEEVARMYGYENFKPTPITTSFTAAINQIDVDIDRRIREYLAKRCGMYEIFSYPWMQEAYVNALFGTTEGVLTLSQPPSPEERFLRSSLLPNLMKAVVENRRYYGEFMIFEGAKIFQDRDYTSEYDERELLPYERRNIAGAVVGDVKNLSDLFRKAKGILEYMPGYTHMEAFTMQQVEKPVWADANVWLNLCLGGKVIGNFALLSKKITLDLGLDTSAVLLFEIDVDELKPFTSRENKFVHLAEFPMNDYDISAIFEEKVAWKDICEVVEKSHENLLKKVSFVDEYRGKQVPAGKKSVTIRLTLGSDTKTLTSAEIEKAAGRILKRLSHDLGAELRS